VLLVAALELDVRFEYDKDWTFTASLKPQKATATLGDIIASILGDGDLDLPDFSANMQFGGQGKDIKIDVQKTKDPNAGGSMEESFQFIAEITVGPLALTFAQYHSSVWPATMPSKRLVKIALTALGYAIEARGLQLVRDEADDDAASVVVQISGASMSDDASNR
jgi:hypothetical protein